GPLLPTDEGFQDHPDDSPKENNSTDSADDLCYDNNPHFQFGGIGSPNDEGFHEQKENQENEDMFLDCSPVKAPFKPIILYEDEVEGAMLPRRPLTANNKEALKRWLELRGITAQGSKDDLVERVAMVMATGKSNIIDPRADNGKWYNAKAAAVREAESHLTVMTQANLEIPDNQRWQPFPSVDLPAMFNFGHIYFYLVESCPNLSFEDNLSDSDSSDCDLLPDPFDDEHKTINEVKMLRKGLNSSKVNL
ncbi:Hormone-sensitive lipase, partial [Frankliniella fusca]